MNTTQARTDLAANIRAAGYVTYDHSPDQLEPPCVVIEPADPYLEYPEQMTFRGAQTGLEMLCNLNVWLLVEFQSSSNEASTADLETQVTAIIPAIVANLGAWELTGVEAPDQVMFGGAWLAYGLKLTVQHPVTITT